ncbi:MAG: transglutaminase family protein [Pseudomonadales bacterium]|nr:transglutaminase family protein [Pseudomonadales bacterium]
MLYEVRHETRFRYEWPVTISHQLLKLRPRRCTRQNVLESRLSIVPHPTVQRDWVDYYGNVVEFATVQGAHSELVVTSASQVEVLPGMNIMLDFSPAWEVVARSLRNPTQTEALAACQYCFESPFIRLHPEIRDFALESFEPGRPLLAATMALTSRIYQQFAYQGGVTDIYTPALDVLRQRRGVCQDFAHLQIACLRALGLPARYVSGYLLTRPPPGQPRLTGADESHAWLSVWCPELGWVDFDPTNNLIPNLEHVTVAWGRDYGDVSPVSGFIFGGGQHEVTVSVDVDPVAARFVT